MVRAYEYFFLINRIPILDMSADDAKQIHEGPGSVALGFVLQSSHTLGVTLNPTHGAGWR